MPGRAVTGAALASSTASTFAKASADGSGSPSPASTFAKASADRSRRRMGSGWPSGWLSDSETLGGVALGLFSFGLAVTGRGLGFEGVN